MPRPIALALLSALALPVAAQTAAAQHDGTPATTAAVAIDPALVGAWELVEVEQEGALGVLATDVESMTCRFGADGEASASMTVEQDAETYARQRTFRFTTADGRIVADGEPGTHYELLDSGELRLRTSNGFTARLRRTDG